ncbi:MAG: citrate synthase [Phycisphaerales bacterium]|nr:citrate synthase [Planctomycetota bacterium]MCH8509204.1 citrate synthase [Phycisphaerales bacterium]
MTTAPASFVKGLEGIVAAQTEMSFIDGVEGVLEYVGIAIGDLAKHSTFEETVYLLWNKRLPKKQELEAFTKELRANYALPDGMLDRIRTVPKQAEPMHMLRTMVSALAMHDESPNDNSVEAAREKSLKILGCTPAIVAAFDRHRRGLDPVAPDAGLGFSANFLYMLNGEKPTDAMTRAFDICMITHADHGLNNSTFTARVVISTLSDMYSAMTAAIGSLRGPLHGGANEGVMKMLNEIPTVADAEKYVMDKLAKKDRIMGFGHRVYKAKDPRAAELMTLAEQLARDTGNMDLYEKSHAIELVMEREVASKGIYPNVDFYSATTYHCIGLKLDLFTPMFALSRIAGWAGHVIEQLDGNRLFRPKAEYVGPHAVAYTPIDKR